VNKSKNARIVPIAAEAVLSIRPQAMDFHRKADVCQSLLNHSERQKTAFCPLIKSAAGHIAAQ
jgi:hypothetical protein